MRTIHKYQLHVGEGTSIEMPSQARLLSVHMQRGQPMLWAMVDPSFPKVNRVIHCLPTGGAHTVGSALLPFLGTVVDDERGLVWHYFDGGQA